jgi:hypothetical protein
MRENIRTDLRKIGINTRNWVDSTQDRDYWSPCECGIEIPGSIKHGVSLFQNYFTNECSLLGLPYYKL